MLDPEKDTGHTGAAGSEGNYLKGSQQKVAKTLLRDSRGHTGTLEATQADRSIQM